MGSEGNTEIKMATLKVHSTVYIASHNYFDYFNLEAVYDDTTLSRQVFHRMRNDMFQCQKLSIGVIWIRRATKNHTKAIHKDVDERLVS